MIEGLRYTYKQSTSRGTPLEVTAPKWLVDDVTSSHGPLHQEVMAHRDKRVLGRRYDGEENVTLDFDLSTNGLSYFHGPGNIRSEKTLEIIAQLDMVAQRRDLADPRITVALSPLGNHSSAIDFPQKTEKEEEFFKVSFERPAGEDDVLTQKIRAGIIQAMDLWRMYNGSDHSMSADVRGSSEEGFRFYMGTYGPDRLILNGDAVRQGRINLYDPRNNTPEERLAALVGIISALETE